MSTFVEIGPGAVLSGMGQQCLPPDAGGAVRHHAAGRPARTSHRGPRARRAADRWRRGERGGAVPGARRVPLPTYAFQRTRHWLTDTAPQAPAAGADDTRPLTAAWPG
ncbi:hypothetical protein [Streptosporangium vulgare]|uniref:hypothetical protein n=1 Tax=Streptosporangium vulgare TaxID=46190 RepID=UPI0031DAA2B8